MPHLGMDQYLLIPFLGEWPSIYQLFWCSPGVPGFWPIPKWRWTSAAFLAISVCAEVPGPRAWRVSDPQMRRLERPSKWQYAAGHLGIFGPWHEWNMIKSHWKYRESLEFPLNISWNPMRIASFQLKSIEIPLKIQWTNPVFRWNQTGLPRRQGCRCSWRGVSNCRRRLKNSCEWPRNTWRGVRDTWWLVTCYELWLNWYLIN